MPHKSAARARKSLALSSIGSGEHSDMFNDAVLNAHPVLAQLGPGATHVLMSPNTAKLCDLQV